MVKKWKGKLHSSLIKIAGTCPRWTPGFLSVEPTSKYSRMTPPRESVIVKIKIKAHYSAVLSRNIHRSSSALWLTD